MFYFDLVTGKGGVGQIIETMFEVLENCMLIFLVKMEKGRVFVGRVPVIYLRVFIQTVLIYVVLK